MQVHVQNLLREEFAKHPIMEQAEKNHKIYLIALGQNIFTSSI